MSEEAKEEVKEGQPHSWWQTLPGVLTAIAGTLTAVTGLIVAISQSGPLFKREPTGTASVSASPTTTKGSIVSVSFPLSEVHAVDYIGTADRDLAYKIVAASLSRSNLVRGMANITFVIRVTNNSRAGYTVNARFFRLIADGDVIAPEGFISTTLFEGNSGQTSVSFYFPETTKNVQLQVGEIDEKTIRLPLSLKIAPR
jgi:hypothetical protein